MKYSGRFFLLIALLICIAAAQRGQFWEKKDYRQWSQRECERLLGNSPWARDYTLGQVINVPLGARDAEGARESNPRVEYTVQFRSALPIRQALVRLSQIEQKYDDMSPDQQRLFDQRMQEFLAEDFSETVLVHVSYSSNVHVDNRDMVRHWERQSTELLKNAVYLIGTKGEKFPLLRYELVASGSREFQFVFPRRYEGRSLVGPGDKVLKLEFPHPYIRGQGGQLFIEFKPERMRVNEEIVY